MKKSSALDSEKYRAMLGGENQRKSEEICFKFLKYSFCFYNLCLLVRSITLTLLLPIVKICIMHV